MLAAALGRHRGHGALDQLEQRLLHTLAAHVTGDRRVVRLAGDLVDFIDVDDAALGLVHVVVTLLQQLLDYVFHVLAHIARFGERGGVGDRERHVEQAGQRLREQGFTTAGGTDKQDIALAQFHFLAAAALAAQALVVVVHGHGKHPLGAFLTDHVIIQRGLDFLGLGQTLVAAVTGLFLDLFADDVVTEIHTLVADKDRRARDQFANFVLALAAERAVQQFAVVALSGVIGHRIASEPGSHFEDAGRARLFQARSGPGDRHSAAFIRRSGGLSGG